MSSGQKYVRNNRAPRVHIEYEVHAPDGVKMVELPFVMGVLADLSGDPREPLKPLEQRKTVEFDANTFDQKMAAIRPRLNFRVDNVLDGDSDTQIPVDIEFESMDDFSPAAVARKVAMTSALFDQREKLQNFLSYIDGNTDVENLLQNLIDDPALRESLLAGAKPAAAAEGGEEAASDG